MTTKETEPRERERVYMRQYRTLHRERIREQQARWYCENRDRLLERAKEHREAQDPEVRRLYFAEYYQQNKPAYRERSRITGLSRRAQKRNQFVEKVDPQEVYERHQGMCGICGDPVDRDCFHIDHIVPLARGGEHSYSNCQPAHPLCNYRKGARLD